MTEKIATKKVWQYFAVGGKYFGEVDLETILMPPYTAIPPLEGNGVDGKPLTIDDQIYNTKTDKWQEIRNTVDSVKIDTLKTLLDEAIADNVSLHNKLSSTQEGLAEVFETITGGNV